MTSGRCRECGAELSFGPDAACPLCGAIESGRKTTREVVDVDSYQSDVQRLREQLRRLRSDAKAV